MKRDHRYPTPMISIVSLIGFWWRLTLEVSLFLVSGYLWHNSQMPQILSKQR